jgi:hypothetical protein
MRLPIKYWRSFALLRDYTDPFRVFNDAILLRKNDLQLLCFTCACVCRQSASATLDAHRKALPFRARPCTL